MYTQFTWNKNVFIRTSIREDRKLIFPSKILCITSVQFQHKNINVKNHSKGINE